MAGLATTSRAGRSTEACASPSTARSVVGREIARRTRRLPGRFYDASSDRTPDAGHCAIIQRLAGAPMRRRKFIGLLGGAAARGEGAAAGDAARGLSPHWIAH